MRATRCAGRAMAVRCRRQLSDRELAVVATVGRYRFLTARQIEELHFADHATRLTGARTCRRVLDRLARSGVLLRLERRIGGVRAGSASYVYALGPLGGRLLSDTATSRIRRREPSEEFLVHTLAVAQLVVDLHRAARAGDIELVEIAPEPACWRQFTPGLEGVQILKPDLSVSLRAGEYEYHWFVEIDLSTHSAAAVVRKCGVYHRYWAAGAEQDRRGIFPKVLFVAPIARRAALLRRRIANTRHLNASLFAVTTAANAMTYLTGAAS